MDDGLILAALDRAERHRGRTSAPMFVILEHLDVAPRSRAAREVRGRLAALTHAGRWNPAARSGSRCSR